MTWNDWYGSHVTNPKRDLQGGPIKSAKLFLGEDSSFHKIRMRSSDSMVHMMIFKNYHKDSYSPRFLEVIHQRFRPSNA